jgi:hypothetical protein
MDLNIRSIGYHHNTKGNGFLLLGIGQGVNLKLTLIQMADLVQFTEEMGKMLSRHSDVYQTS